MLRYAWILGFLVIATSASGSPLLGKPCPDLKLTDYMLQGDLITPEDLPGKVVFVDLYQRGCPRCESNSMPHLQQLYAKWKDDPRVLIFAINTAFEKNEYPWMADEDGTRQHLRQKGWEMPVARDLDEQTVRAFGIDGSYGTPMAFVLDANGEVIEHRWNSTPDDARALEQTFEAAVAALQPGIALPDRELHSRLRSALDRLEKGDYSAALQAATRLADSASTDDRLRDDAAFLRDHIEQGFRVHLDQVRELFARDPLSALDRADALDDIFRGMPGLTEFHREVSGWQQSADFKDMQKMTLELDKIEKRLRKSPLQGRARDQAADLLERITSTYPESNAARRARKAQRLLGAG